MTGGFSYEVSDEQIAAYSALPIDRRVRWVEEHARMTYALATKEVREHWARLRRGLDPWSLPSATRIRQLTYVATATLDGRTSRIEMEESLIDALFPFPDLEGLDRDSAARHVTAWMNGVDGGPDAFDGEELSLENPASLASHLRGPGPARVSADAAIRRDVELCAARFASFLECAAREGVVVTLSFG